ncbi:MAG: hypothetical protein JSV84_10775 [Gemmatimonadota bacterium]|nr:MAG: hypothetical protein JSV84_10775 [Gemmatimonadota bacterium]
MTGCSEKEQLTQTPPQDDLQKLPQEIAERMGDEPCPSGSLIKVDDPNAPIKVKREESDAIRKKLGDPTTKRKTGDSIRASWGDSYETAYGCGWSAEGWVIDVTQPYQNPSLWIGAASISWPLPICNIYVTIYVEWKPLVGGSWQPLAEGYAFDYCAMWAKVEDVFSYSQSWCAREWSGHAFYDPAMPLCQEFYCGGAWYPQGFSQDCALWVVDK